MLQRIQTVYLIAAALISGLLAFLVPFYGDTNGGMLFLADLIQIDAGYYRSIPVLFIVSTIISVVSIFLFKRRSRQISSNRVNIVINFLLLGIIVYRLLNLPGEMNISEKGIGVFMPLLIIVLLALASKAIIKDEKLVKSVDRLR